MTVAKIRQLLETLRKRFGIRLFDAIGGGGSITLLTDGSEIYARSDAGQFFQPAEVARPAHACGGKRRQLEGVADADALENPQEEDARRYVTFHHRGLRGKTKSIS
jgi:hypothetical protein